MDNEYHELKRMYQLYKEGKDSKVFRENLADRLEQLKYVYMYNRFNQSDLLSYIIGKDVIYSERLLYKIINEIRYHGTEIVVPSSNTPEWRPCLVGNIIDEHEYGDNHEIRRGTKQFPPGAKVYLAPGQWGDGYEHIYVIGKPRKSKSLIQIIMSSSKIVNYRVQKVYSPTILNLMEASEINWWDNNNETLDMLNEAAMQLNNPEFKYGIDERTQKLTRVIDILSEKYDVTNSAIRKRNQQYPIINIQASEQCICANYYGYVNTDGSAFIEHYYQISAEEIAKIIENHIESYDYYRLITREDCL